jgi:hypothetical protein
MIQVPGEVRLPEITTATARCHAPVAGVFFVLDLFGFDYEDDQVAAASVFICGRFRPGK